MRKLLCCLFGLHHFVYVEPSPVGFCKHCERISTKIMTSNDWEKMRAEILERFDKASAGK